MLAKASLKLEAGGETIRATAFREVAELMLGVSVGRLRALETEAVRTRDDKRNHIRKEVNLGAEWDVTIKHRTICPPDGEGADVLWNNLVIQSAKATGNQRSVRARHD